MLEIPCSQNWPNLRTSQVEKTFTQVPIDLHEILILDGIDFLSSPSRIRIRSHDLYGPLPDILIEDTGDRYPVLDEIEREAAKLIAIVRVRKKPWGMYPECEFLLPTRTDGGLVTGVRF